MEASIVHSPLNLKNSRQFFLGRLVRVFPTRVNGSSKLPRKFHKFKDFRIAQTLTFNVRCSTSLASEGLNDESKNESLFSEMPVKMHQTITLPAALHVEEAMAKLSSAVADLIFSPPCLGSGVLRFQVPLPRDVKALAWLKSKTRSSRAYPRIFFTAQNCGDCEQDVLEDLSSHPSAQKSKNIFNRVAGIGSAITFKGSCPFSFGDYQAIRRFLSAESSFVRAYGCMCFKSTAPWMPEWSDFGSFFFCIPQMELDEMEDFSFLAVTLAWDEALLLSFQKASSELQFLLQETASYVEHPRRLSFIKPGFSPDCPSSEALTKKYFEGTKLKKQVSFARKTQITAETTIDSLPLLASLQENDRDNLQFYIELADKVVFMGNTLQGLFRRRKLFVSSDIHIQPHSLLVADTQHWKHESDIFSRSGVNNGGLKFIVQTIKTRMQAICKWVAVTEMPESSNANIMGELKCEIDEFNLLSSLNPSSFVTEYPEDVVLQNISQNESFEQGKYGGGPVGWFGYDDSDFALATGAAMLQNTKLERLLESQNMVSLPNINALWAYLIVDECSRLGITYFCVAPGSRSSALAIAAGQNPAVTCITCIDERSLAFHALGFAKGANKPAAVITSSGTAVSNLFPAIVEASQESIPLLLLTGDRPPELHDTGANQTINQVNHFGSYVRHFINLPPPDDKLPAKMVLTAIDNAVYRAMKDPGGPVHINCGFREPLAGVPCEWTSKCLKGLERWTVSREPYTKYIKKPDVDYSICDQYIEVLELIQGSSRGLLVVGGLKTSAEAWAVLALAKLLQWPVIPDILSGLRLRKLLSKVAGMETGFCFIDLLDNILLEESAKNWLCPDVVIQVGSRLTSKRVSQFLEDCSLDAYIMVDTHPFRHDPAHILTHRIQDSILGFTKSIERFYKHKEKDGWSLFLELLNDMVDWEVSFQLNIEPILTEPCVSRVITETLSSESVFFVGNSMPIRDADMYGKGWSKIPHGLETNIEDVIPFSAIRVAGNRGASGIDGLLSTAVGYAAGSKQRVIFAVGDISFLHDTNGLAFLNKGEQRPPVTVLVTNNHGGSIFSLLPVAKATPASIFEKLFTMPHQVSMKDLCSAHSIKYLLVQTKEELKAALVSCQCGQVDSVIEINSQTHFNVEYHSFLQQSVRKAVNTAFQVVSCYNEGLGVDCHNMQVLKIEYMRYRIPLVAQLTTSNAHNHSGKLYKEGFLMILHLENGIKGYGEIAPIGIENENILDVEEQLRYIVQKANKISLNSFMLVLSSSFQRWIWKDLGIPAFSLFPSVRCGLEMAALTALAASKQCSFADFLCGFKKTPNLTTKDAKIKALSAMTASNVNICALLDSEGSPEEVAEIAERLVKEGFSAIKLKVARRGAPVEDAAVIQAVRKKVGSLIQLRVDANRKWTFSQAMQFANGVKDCNLQYIEEPVNNQADLLRFSEESGLFVALDETIDEMADISLDEMSFEKLSTIIHPCIIATIIKPCRVGGFERSSLLARWALKHGMIPVISATFESSVGLSALAQFARYIDCQYLEVSEARGKEADSLISHGLGTYKWIHEDVLERNLQFQNRQGAGVEVNIKDAAAVLQNVKFNPNTVNTCHCNVSFDTYTKTVHHLGSTYNFHTIETRTNNVNESNKEMTLVFLHGFLGNGNEWIPLMQALSISARCISVDLPGHGKTQVQKGKDNSQRENNNNPGKMVDADFSVEATAQALSKLLSQITSNKVVLVGYSMGARIALYMSLKHNEHVVSSVLISGSPGLQDSYQREIRCSQDDALAEMMVSMGLKHFIKYWYQKKMWASLRFHPCFEEVQQERSQHDNINDLAKVLSSMSAGRQQSLWNELSFSAVPILLIVGKKDDKFKSIAQKMCSKLGNGGQIEMLEVEAAGHAVHIENPMPVIYSIRNFCMKKNKI